MTTFRLAPHPATPCGFVRALTVQAEPVGEGLQLTYTVTGDMEQLDIPALRQPSRLDGLWRETCFEIFLRTTGSPSYQEFNFSPSGAWAAYAFSEYRHGMTSLEQPEAPRIVCTKTTQEMKVDVLFHSALLARTDLQAGLSAVLKHRDGSFSYWALAHPQAKPDFHDAAGFVRLGEGDGVTR